MRQVYDVLIDALHGGPGLRSRVPEWKAELIQLLALPLFLAAGRLPARDGHAWTPEELYKLFPNLGTMRDRRGSAMSGGEQQMLSMARTLMGNPSCILLDEPSEGLAPIILEGIAAAILELKRRGVGLLVSEQNLHFARTFADRISIMENGAIRFTGTLAVFDADPALAEQYLSV